MRGTLIARQKIVLATLLAANRPVSKTELVKWIFLMNKETGLGKQPGFYEFLPYKYGPFSFQLFRDLTDLERSGYVAVCDDHIDLGLEDEAREKVTELSVLVRAATNAIVEKYGHLGVSELIDGVYEKYRWYAVLSERVEATKYRLPQIPTALPAVYTVGYEGHSIDGFFDKLLIAGIKRIIDVRYNPMSRKYGFSKKTLENVSAGLGLRYEHFGNLGIHPSFRAELESAQDYQELLSWYDSTVLEDERNCVEFVAKSMTETPSALLCYEKDAAYCHRSRVGQRLSEITGLEVINL